MTITDVLNESIVAVFKAPVASRTLVLKGGSAMRLFENDNQRLSIDADFSLNDAIEDESRFFASIQTSLSDVFGQRELIVIDFRYRRRPLQPKKSFPASWGGWKCSFKLVNKIFRHKTAEVKRKNALIPEGANSSVVDLDISDGEYCGAQRSKTVGGVKIHGYTKELLVLEKIRAICQQHPSYQFTSNKNRSRDFYDIQRLTQQVDDAFTDKCRRHLEKVFKAKCVPLDLLRVFWDEDFISVQEKGFQEVIDTVRGKTETFEVYVEHIRRLIRMIAPDTISALLASGISPGRLRIY